MIRLSSRAAVYALHGLTVGMVAVAIVTPLSAQMQFAAGAALVGAAVVIRSRVGAAAGPILSILSIVASSRYMWWRVSSTLDFDTTFDWVLGLSLLGAEVYAFTILLLGAFQTLHVLHRRPIPLPVDRSHWPTIDVFIPTYNEPLEVVRPTVLAALRLDWPRDKLCVHLLDDGSRAEFRDFAARVNVHYVVREEHKHAKAGNLNHALSITNGELIAIFDCDHVVTRSFLQLSVGWFVRDPCLAMLQTPHHFYNADPIERNLHQFRRVPNEGELFYGYLQGGNDFWNATFFCGSCAVLRRSALAEVGGIATESLTEDALTSLKLQRLGYRTAYLNVRQAAGLATDTLAAHIGQRVRWAQGMAQILRVSNPLFGRGLAVGQRLCYFNASLHFLYGLPRLIFLLGPIAYLVFGAHICAAAPATLIAYLLPHLVHAMLVDMHTRRRFRYAFWNNIYETVLAIYILLPTLTAIFRPRAGVFKVTDKGQTGQGGFDRRIARPYFVLLLVCFTGLALAFMRLLLWDYYDPGTVVLNLTWCLFSVFTLGAVLAVACEAPQLRGAHRLPTRLSGALRTPSGHLHVTETHELSLSGASVRHPGAMAISQGEKVELGLFLDGEELWLSGRVAGLTGGRTRIAFDPLSTHEESGLVEILFGRPDAWVDWEQGRPEDRPLTSLRMLLGESLRGIRSALVAERQTATVALVAITVLTACFLLSHTGWRVQPVVDRVSALGPLVGEWFTPTIR